MVVHYKCSIFYEKKFQEQVVCCCLECYLFSATTRKDGPVWLLCPQICSSNWSIFYVFTILNSWLNFDGDNIILLKFSAVIEISIRVILWNLTFSKAWSAILNLHRILLNREVELSNNNIFSKKVVGWPEMWP